MLKLTEDNWENEVLKSDKLVLVDFWAEWCRPCLMLAPVLEELSQEYEGTEVVIGKLNTDENRNISMQYGIRAIPTMLFFHKGEVVHRLIGVMPKDILKGSIEEARDKAKT